jgi:hypothetical protein
VNGSIDGSGDAAERAQGTRAQAALVKGVATSDAVIVTGHSRGGGGPDFFPARRLLNGHINYAWYRHNRPGFGRLLATLDKHPDHQPMVIGLISCDTKNHFYRDLKPHAKGTGFVFSNAEALWVDELNATVGTLNSLLGEKCKEAFTRNINPPSSFERGRFLVQDLF